MKNKNKIKIAIFVTLIFSMIYYIGWVFYQSEPQYIDSCYKTPEKFDYVSLPDYKYSWQPSNGVTNGIVLQVDSSKALVKCSDEFYELEFKTSKYRIIGKGTIYHKVNNYIGFNIMVISQVFVVILISILIYTLMAIIKDFFN
jgi:hypothetical protein